MSNDLERGGRAVNEKKRLDRMEYAVKLLELSQTREKSPSAILKAGLAIMEFGGISIKEMQDYLEVKR